MKVLLTIFLLNLLNLVLILGAAYAGVPDGDLMSMVMTLLITEIVFSVLWMLGKYISLTYL